MRAPAEAGAHCTSAPDPAALLCGPVKNVYKQGAEHHDRGDWGIRASMRVCVTERLSLRRMTLRDAAFILQLLNEPPFLRFIGDKGVRTLEDACRYIETGPVAS